MTDLEPLLTQVWNPDTRPFAEESWRCYNSGAIRASIAATWTAVAADIIAKLIQLADDGDAGAAAFQTEVAKAQKNGINPAGVRAMQKLEANLLSKAAEFELIDSIGKRELERIHEDRNLCVHPSLRSFSEAYSPRPEIARGHLAVALSTLLIHPPIQGGMVLKIFEDYVCDRSFVPAVSHIQAIFFDRVRTGARKNIVKLAAKYALRELAPGGRLPATEYADRAAFVLSALAQRDRELVHNAVAQQREHFQRLDGDKQLRTLARLGNEDFFWAAVDDALADRLQALLRAAAVQPWEPLRYEIAECLAIVRNTYARSRIPAIEQCFEGLGIQQQMYVVTIQPASYFVATVLKFIREAWTFRIGEQAGQLLVQHGRFLGIDDLRCGLEAWADNDQCRRALQMPALAVELFHETSQLGMSRTQLFVDFLTKVQLLADDGDSYYRYPALEEMLRGDGHID